ncbi:T9SS-dependent choice-of-anchor J family protein [Winogradskyella helgolandensis]|uniref:T9SS-dependent choice-of-anchor J family protein n=1 Tax=Winogradskyella helgolandensis TaxID=2697010 RepID=UPI0015C1B796|nr:choice-of-anchor J domain-containing protein [Winogradskyella helgolandensis]
MKKITLLVLAVLLSITANAQLNEDFEGATFPPDGWTTFIGTNGLGTAQNWGVAPIGTTNTAMCFYEVLGVGERSEDWLVTPQITILATAPTLSFQSVDSGTTEYGSIFTVRVSTTSQTTHGDFSIVATQTEADIAHSQSTMEGSEFTVDLSAYVGQAIYIAFVLEQNDGDLWRIDNVELEGPCLETAAPSCVTEISPVNNDAAAITGPNSSVTFTWNEDPNADSYELFINGFSQGERESGITFVGLGYSTDYTWSVVPSNCFGEATGCPEWSFTTQACTETAPPVTAATAPVPADAATVDLSDPDAGLTFNYTAANPDDYYTLVIDTANPPAEETAFTAEDFPSGNTLTGLAVSTTYYWRIDITNCAGTTQGPVWSFTTGDVLSIEDNELEAPLSVYPNPTSGILNIKSNQDIDTVAVFNLLGQNVASFTKSSIIDSSVNLSELSNGLYLVKITSGDKTQTIRVTKE